MAWAVPECDFVERRVSCWTDWFPDGVRMFIGGWPGWDGHPFWALTAGCGKLVFCYRCGACAKVEILDVDETVYVACECHKPGDSLKGVNHG